MPVYGVFFLSFSKSDCLRIFDYFFNVRHKSESSFLFISGARDAAFANQMIESIACERYKLAVKCGAGDSADF